MGKEKLKPCPFCGNNVEIKWSWGHRPNHTKEYGIYWHKEDCFLHHQSKMLVWSDKQQAINAWNRRVSNG